MPEHSVPPLPCYLTDGFRAAAEYGWLLASGPILAALPRGDGHPVLVLPGLMTHRHVERWELPLEHGQGPLPVPVTSIYSRLDGLVAWRACLDEPGPRAENVAVFGSHFGLGHHPAVLWAVADRLAQPEGRWTPFRAPIPLRAALPHPDRVGGAGQPPPARVA